jgi:hypothetical protein
MPRSAHLAASLALVLTCGACASGGSTPTTRSPDRVIMTTQDGSVLRQQIDAATKATFPSSPDKVWAAVVGAYADLGIEANSWDKTQGHYAAQNFIMPRRIKNVGITALFSCGSSMTGPVADQGRIMADVVTKLLPNPDGTTSATIYVDGMLKKNEGASSDPIHCSSSGRIEELLRKSITMQLAQQATGG